MCSLSFVHHLHQSTTTTPATPVLAHPSDVDSIQPPDESQRVRFEFLRFWFPLAVGGVGCVLHQTVDGFLAV
jgi:hypothetical protein